MIKPKANQREAGAKRLKGTRDVPEKKPATARGYEKKKEKKKRGQLRNTGVAV